MFTDSIAAKRFSEIVKEFNIQLAIETGTDAGIGSFSISTFCPVLTVEVNPQSRWRALINFLNSGCTVSRLSETWSSPYVINRQGAHPIISHLCDSGEFLCRMETAVNIPEKGKGLLVFLDAHWNAHAWPLLAELSALAKHGLSEAVIVVHDCQVPGRPELGFDCYNNQPLNYEYVREALAKINPHYRIEFNSKSSTNRGILYVFPNAPDQNKNQSVAGE